MGEGTARHLLDLVEDAHALQAIETLYGEEKREGKEEYVGGQRWVEGRGLG
jgi:hypothetical protein